MKNDTKIGERIKELRESKGVTQQALADALSVTRSTVNMWENGGRDLKTDAIIALCDYFNVTTDFLLCRTKYGTVDKNLQTACETTGLSEKAVKQFMVLKEFDEEHSTTLGMRVLPGISSLIENLIKEGVMQNVLLNTLHYAMVAYKNQDPLTLQQRISAIEFDLLRKKESGSIVVDPDIEVDYYSFCLHKAICEIEELCKEESSEVFSSCYGMTCPDLCDTVLSDFARFSENTERN